MAGFNPAALLGPPTNLVPVRHAPPSLYTAVVRRLLARPGFVMPDNQAKLQVGEADYLVAAVTMTSGTAEVESVTFQLLQNEVPVAPPNGAISYAAPVLAGRMQSSPDSVLLARHRLRTTRLAPGAYIARFLFRLRTDRHGRLVATADIAVTIV